MCSVHRWPRGLSLPHQWHYIIQISIKYVVVNTYLLILPNLGCNSKVSQLRRLWTSLLLSQGTSVLPVPQLTLSLKKEFICLVWITALNASRFLPVVFHTDLCQPAVSTCPLSSLIRINSCELYHEILERNMRDYAGEWGTSVTVLRRWGGLYHETHFPSLGSTQVTTVHKDMTYWDMFCEILWN